MPRMKQPATLQTLALSAVGKFVTAVGRKMINPICSITSHNTPEGMNILQQSLDRLNELLYSSVPWYLFDDMVTEVLTAVSDLIHETKSKVNHLDMSVFINQMNVVVNLTEVAIHPLLRRIDFSMWTKIMRHVLYKRLDRMIGLEVLNLGSGTAGWKTSDAEKTIVSSIRSMKNLRMLCLCFDCTDHILSVVGECCEHLLCLDVTSSRSVTDRSVASLLNCKKIKDLRLYRTSVSVEGYARLFLGLPKLEDLGHCDEFVVDLDLHDKQYITGSKKCKRVRLRLDKQPDFKFNLLIAWEPPNEQVCPSSIAAFLSSRGYEVSVRTPSLQKRADYGVAVPLLPEESDIQSCSSVELVEWLGAYNIGADLKSDNTENYLSSYQTPAKNQICQLVNLQWSGFFTKNQVHRTFEKIRTFINSKRPSLWASIYVQGFADSPVSWGLKEHQYYTNGDNNYVIFLQPDGIYLTCSILSSNKRPSHKLSSK